MANTIQLGGEHLKVRDFGDGSKGLASVLYDTAGAALFSTANPGRIAGTVSVEGFIGGTVAVAGTVPVTVVSLPTLTEDTAHQSGDQGFMFLAVRRDTPTALAADGDYIPVTVDVNGALHVNLATLLAGEDQTGGVLGTLMKPVSSATYAPTLYQNVAGNVTKANIKASAGNVYSVRFINKNASPRYLQLHNKATAPAATETPQLSFLVPGGTADQPAVLELDSTWFAPSARFTTGIGWAVSTTAGNFTDSATASEHEVQVRYV
ncbi:MAG: hypothetical protein HY689_02990 [Chloroflexi bacterium]|nr:hypothetical protein [Chloroflexota bacterium]